MHIVEKYRNLIFRSFIKNINYITSYLSLEDRSLRLEYLKKECYSFWVSRYFINLRNKSF